MCDRMAGPSPPKKLRISELNPHLLCALCGGYLIDATTIIECLHSFCKTCILRYLETSNYCPICEVLIHKTRPWQNIRLDNSLQNAVYKMVPGLFQSEMRRRREFYEKQNTHGKGSRNGCQLEGEIGDRIIFSQDEEFSISIEFSPDGKPVKETTSKSLKRPKGTCQPDKRYLKCPAGLRVEHLKKFIRYKFSLPQTVEIDLFYESEPLSDTYSLMDVAYIYIWKRDCVLRLFYSFYEVPLKVRKVEAAINVTEKISKSKVKDKNEEPSQKREESKKAKSKREKSKERKQSKTSGKRKVSADGAAAGAAQVAAEQTAAGPVIKVKRKQEDAISPADRLPPNKSVTSQLTNTASSRSDYHLPSNSVPKRCGQKGQNAAVKRPTHENPPPSDPSYSIADHSITKHSNTSPDSHDVKAGIKLLIRSSDVKECQLHNGDIVPQVKDLKCPFNESVTVQKFNGGSKLISKSNLFEKMDNLAKSSQVDFTNETVVSDSSSSQIQKQLSNCVKLSDKEMKCDIKRNIDFVKSKSPADPTSTISSQKSDTKLVLDQVSDCVIKQVAELRTGTLSAPTNKLSTDVTPVCVSSNSVKVMKGCGRIAKRQAMSETKPVHLGLLNVAPQVDQAAPDPRNIAHVAKLKEASVKQASSVRQTECKVIHTNQNPKHVTQLGPREQIRNSDISKQNPKQIVNNQKPSIAGFEKGVTKHSAGDIKHSTGVKQNNVRYMVNDLKQSTGSKQDSVKHISSVSSHHMDAKQKGVKQILTSSKQNSTETDASNTKQGNIREDQNLTANQNESKECALSAKQTSGRQSNSADKQNIDTKLNISDTKHDSIKQSISDTKPIVDIKQHILYTKGDNTKQTGHETKQTILAKHVVVNKSNSSIHPVDDNKNNNVKQNIVATKHESNEQASSYRKLSSCEQDVCETKQNVNDDTHKCSRQVLTESKTEIFDIEQAIKMIKSETKYSSVDTKLDLKSVAINAKQNIFDSKQHISDFQKDIDDTKQNTAIKDGCDSKQNTTTKQPASDPKQNSANLSVNDTKRNFHDTNRDITKVATVSKLTVVSTHQTLAQSKHASSSGFATSAKTNILGSNPTCATQNAEAEKCGTPCAGTSLVPKNVHKLPGSDSSKGIIDTEEANRPPHNAVDSVLFVNENVKVRKEIPDNSSCNQKQSSPSKQKISDTPAPVMKPLHLALGLAPKAVALTPKIKPNTLPNDLVSSGSPLVSGVATTSHSSNPLPAPPKLLKATSVSSASANSSSTHCSVTISVTAPACSSGFAKGSISVSDMSTAAHTVSLSRSCGVTSTVLSKAASSLPCATVAATKTTLAVPAVSSTSSPTVCPVASKSKDMPPVSSKEKKSELSPVPWVPHLTLPDSTSLRQHVSSAVGTSEASTAAAATNVVAMKTIPRAAAVTSPSTAVSSVTSSVTAAAINSWPMATAVNVVTSFLNIPTTETSKEAQAKGGIKITENVATNLKTADDIIKLDNFLFDTKTSETISVGAANCYKAKEPNTGVRPSQKSPTTTKPSPLAPVHGLANDKPSKQPEPAITAIHQLPKTISQSSKHYPVARSVSVSSTSGSKCNSNVIQTTKISTLIPKSASISSRSGTFSKSFSYPSTINNVPSSRSFLHTSLSPHLARPEISVVMNGSAGFDRAMMTKASALTSLQTPSPAAASSIHKTNSSKHGSKDTDNKAEKSAKGRTIPPLTIPKSCLISTTLKLQRSPGSTDHYIFAPLSQYGTTSHHNGERSRSKDVRHNGSRTLASPPTKDDVFIGERQRVPTIKISDINRNPIIVDSTAGGRHHPPYRSYSRGSSRSSASENGSSRSNSRGGSDSLSPSGSSDRSDRSPARDARRPSDSELLISQHWHGYPAADLLFNGFKLPAHHKFHELHYDTDAMPLDYSQSSSKS